ncbi:MAG TPA: hypothetical protein VK879_20170 [Candidatus Sulfomarinibacteraceae bacterium]|nr:hypothetical protein [Candidatus Sulfomarinibacteraceae bacterium]
MSETDPRKLESYLEQKEACDGGLDPEVERLVDSLQQWQHEAELQPRAGFLNEVAQQLQEEQQAGSRAGRIGVVLKLTRRLLAGAVGVAAVAAFVLFVAGLFEQPPVEPAAGEGRTPLSAAVATPSPTHVPLTIQVGSDTITLIPGENISPENYGLAQDMAFRLSADWVLVDGLWEPIASDTPLDICEIDPHHPDCEGTPALAQTPVPTLPPTPAAAGQHDSCAGVPRPAIVLGSDISLDRLNLTVVEPFSGGGCHVASDAYTPGTLAISGDTLYYPRRDRDGGTITIVQQPFDGAPAPLPFTTTPALSAPWFGLAVAPDEQHMVWATFSDEVEGASDARFRSTVWLGDLEKERATLLWQEDEPDTLPPTIEPLFISAEENVVYFARRPYGIGGAGPFPAQYSGLYALPLNGGEPQPVFTCETPFDFCLNDVDFERRLLGTVASEGERATLHLVSFDGAEVARYTTPDANYVGDPVFGPNGDVAFIAATVERPEQQAPVFRPGAIRLWQAPYDGEPQTLAQNTDVFFDLWFWFGDNHLLSGDWDDGRGLALLSLSGERIVLPGSGTERPLMVLPK